MRREPHSKRSRPRTTPVGHRRSHQCAGRVGPPGGAAALLFVKFPSQGPKLTTAFLVERFGFTPAEATFAHQVCEGRGLAAAAERQGIRLSTARTHLARIFDKTGTRRQAELVRPILESEGPARGDDEEVGSVGGQRPSVAEAARSRRPLNGAAEKMPSIV